MHLLYTLIALMLVGVLSLSAMRMSAFSEQRMISNEIMTQVTGVADEIFDHAAGYPFDEATNEDKFPIQPPTFPIITTATISNLTGTSDPYGYTTDGWGGCSAATVYSTDVNMGQKRMKNSVRPKTCDDLDDLHGLSIDVDRDGLTYTADVSVVYVNPSNPTSVSSSKTFMKRVDLTITVNDYVIAGSPLQVEFTRIFPYNRVTQ